MENKVKVYCTLRSGGKECSRLLLSLGTTNLPYCIYTGDIKYLVTLQVKYDWRNLRVPVLSLT